ncbi:protein draper-like isoform X1 [Crassostrea angulata]|uniref:protein draper-like isoform X1 n=1 Tax=Magallana angulata TaxID=2784310 RepID=UPI0022B0E0A3|nr:protein draper-like isoform X1 [Crassostrea angulata]
MRTLEIGQNAPKETVWWKVDLGAVYNIYRINILFRNYDGYGCANASVYGKNCDTPCPTNCKNNTCHIQNGTCFTCIPGWTGHYCNTKCEEGWYGFSCSQQCEGQCRDGTICNHENGHCEKGCDAAWTGTFCDIECDNGTYGLNCVKNCSGHCLNNSPCNKQTGKCNKGCNPGYTNGDCSKECLKGYFGLNCKERCSGQCANSEPCDHINGVCHSGCQDGYIGNNCKSACGEGYFGHKCSLQCSPNCKSETCRHTDGWCTCAAGLKADNCTTGSTEHQLMNQNSPNCIILAVGLSVSILMNIILIACQITLCRKDNSNIFKLSCWKRSVYQDAVFKREESSTYQEIDLSENAYQNSTIR